MRYLCVSSVVAVCGVIISCGSSDDKPPAAGTSTSSSGGSSGTSSSGGSSSGGSSSGGSSGSSNDGGGNDADAASDGGSGGLVKCTTSDGALPEAKTSISVAVTTEGATTVLYVAINDTGVGFDPPTLIRRYTLQAGAGCTLQRDNAFGDAGVVSAVVGSDLYADTSGNLWTMDTFDSVKRVHPSALNCTKDAAFNGKLPSSMTMDPTGTVGYATFSGTDVFGKITASANACSIAPVTFTNTPVAEDPSGGAHLAIDGTGRLQELDLGPLSNVLIYTSGGAFVAKYSGDSPHAYQDDLARCGTGMCLLESNPQNEKIFTRCNADGASCKSIVLPFKGSSLVASPITASFLHVQETNATAIYMMP